MEVLARIHNGGPRGHQKAATLAYARKLMAYVRR
jgi:ribosomal protein S9